MVYCMAADTNVIGNIRCCYKACQLSGADVMIKHNYGYYYCTCLFSLVMFVAWLRAYCMLSVTDTTQSLINV